MNLNKAIAYFKPAWDSNTPPDIELSKEEQPVGIPYCEGLSVLYLLDEVFTSRISIFKELELPKKN